MQFVLTLCVCVCVCVCVLLLFFGGGGVVLFCFFVYSWFSVMSHLLLAWWNCLSDIFGVFFQLYVNELYSLILHYINGDSSVVEQQTCDWKVSGLSPGRSSQRSFFSRVNFLHYLFQYLFRPSVTTVARKRARPFCQMCRWQSTAKHAYILCMRLQIKGHCKLVHGYIVYTNHDLDSSSFTQHQPCNK